MRLNDTYLQQFIRKGVPRILPAEIRDALASTLKVAPDLLTGAGPVQRRGRPRKSNALAKPHNRTSVPTEPTINQPPANIGAGFLKRDELIAVFTCPSLLAESYVTDWVERPAQYAGARPAFAIWVPASVGRLRLGDLAFVHSAHPADRNDAIVIAAGDRVVDVGELIRRSDSDATVLTATGELSFQLPKHRIMRIALTVFR